ncbi:SET domain containing 8 isoform X2 [Arctopsyche grandis]|uniref:SET domain containing 8 isoform X2 n=1 Tax=Arctopsyche grandis TaxID=121162 RepID=UPI00406D99D2
MERCNGFSPPMTRSRRNVPVKTITDTSPKNGHITSYFQIVSTVDCFDEDKPSSDLYDGNALSSINDDYAHYDEIKNDPFQFNIADINDIIYSDKPDKKKLIINNIFKKDHTYNGRINNVNITKVFVKEEPVDSIEDTESDTDVKEESLNVRLSPRKHASTLQRSTVKENIKTPHRISLCDDEIVSSHSIGQLAFQTYKHRTKRRLNSKMCNKKLYGDDFDSSDSSSNKTESKDKVLKCSKVATIKQCKVNGVTNVANHKLTEYFPVRRSVRKTKKEVMEQKQKDLELAIQEQREDGLTVSSFEGKGRGIVASRMFRRGDYVVEYAGELVDIAEARLREAHYAQDHTAGCYMYYFRHNNQNYCIDATSESGRLGRLVNHSRNGNLITKSIFIGSKPHLVLIANQDISVGEEVTYDYGDRSKESLQHHPWLAL